MNAIRHGTSYHYDQGCRCDDCKEAKYAEKRKWRVKARAEGRSSYEHELAHARENKLRYRGSCEVCGKPTTGCNGPGKAPTLCVKHSNAQISRARIGTGPRQAEILELIAAGTDRYTDIVNALGISTGHGSNLLTRLLRYGLVERWAHGRYRVTELSKGSPNGERKEARAQHR